MSTVAQKRWITPEEYLAMERAADYKSEYFNGEVFAMTGATRRHNLVVGNSVRRLGNQLEDKPCEVYPSDMRVLTPSGLYTYPDVVVVCGEPEFDGDREDTLLNPTVLAEALSKSTATYDRGDKFAHYRTLNSLMDYLVIAQDKPRVEHHTRQSDTSWLLTEWTDLNATIELPSIGCTLALSDIYRKINFAQPE